MRAALDAHFGATLAVIITDSFGRAWRRGTAGVAIGAAGLPALLRPARQARPVRPHPEVSSPGFADEIAAAASLVMGEATRRSPSAWCAGSPGRRPTQPAAELVRPAAEDLFR